MTPLSSEDAPRYLRPKGNVRVRRRRQGRAAMRILFWCLLWAAGAALAAAGFGEGMKLLMDTEQFPLRCVLVEGDDPAVNHDVESLLSGLAGKNILALDLESAERLAASHPWVEKASVRRRLPSSLLVILETRRAEALVLSGNGVHLTDAGGNDLGAYGPDRASLDFPILTGAVGPGGRADRKKLIAGIEACRRLREEAPEFASLVSALDLSRPDRLTATLRDFRPPVYLSAERPALNTGRVADVRRRLDAEAMEVEYLDLRFADRIAVMPVRSGEERSGA